MFLYVQIASESLTQQSLNYLIMGEEGKIVLGFILICLEGYFAWILFFWFKVPQGSVLGLVLFLILLMFIVVSRKKTVCCPLFCPESFYAHTFRYPSIRDDILVDFVDNTTLSSAVRTEPEIHIKLSVSF